MRFGHIFSHISQRRSRFHACGLKSGDQLTTGAVAQDRLQKLCVALTRSPALSLRANTLKNTAQQLAERVKEHIASLKHPQVHVIDDVVLCLFLYNLSWLGWQAAKCAAAVHVHPQLPDVVTVPSIPAGEPVEALEFAKGVGHVWIDRCVPRMSPPLTCFGVFQCVADSVEKPS